MSTAVVAAPPKLEKKPIKFSNLLLGAGLNMFEGQIDNSEIKNA
jgi:hypothetical protein